MRHLLLGLLLVFAVVANAAPSKPVATEERFINKQVGKLRFVLNNISGEPFSREELLPAEIVVYQATGQVRQKLSVEVGIADPGFYFLDANDDGYVDLLLYDTCGGYIGCVGPLLMADVFLYAPKLGRFVQSQTLSGRGDISKSKHKGCVIAQYKSSATGYTNEEWCFNLKTGRWPLAVG